jgi:hypothetical protein
MGDSMSVTLQSSGGGSVTLLEPATASNFTVTMPAATGTAMVSGNMPAFSAYIATQQTLSSGVATKMQCATEEFDTANCYDNTTNYRFTPNVAGYYQVNGEYDLQSGAPTRALISIWKNGSEFKRGNDIGVTSGTLANGAGAVISALIYLNGSTDYIELYAFYADGGVLVGGNPTQSYFQAFLARAA